MGFKFIVILFSIVLSFTLLTCVALGSDSVSRLKLLEGGRNRGLANSKKHAVRSIMSEDGDIIDCIDIYKQPAFNHPALKNHTIQMEPSYDTLENTITTAAKPSKRRKEDPPVTITSQLWQRSGSCPQGTIPVRRVQKKTALKPNYGRKEPSFFHPIEQSDNTSSTFLRQNRSLAIMFTLGYSYLGVKGDIKVWNPTVESSDEYSTSQVALKSGPYNNFEAIESGWAVNPSVYGDKQTRLFVYWTADASRTTGCFDLTCPGFVQTNTDIALGAAIYPISVPGGLPYQISIYIYQDPDTSNWWVQYGERINIGYWPPELFGMLRHHAETAQWGGEVYSSKVGVHPHTTTAMGNGHFPDYIFGNSGCVKRMRILDVSLQLKYPEYVESHSDEYDCYDVFYLGDYIEDPEFYYGGPGKNPRCP